MKMRGPVTIKETGLGQKKKDAPHAAEDLDGGVRRVGGRLRRHQLRLQNEGRTGK